MKPFHKAMRPIFQPIVCGLGLLLSQTASANHPPRPAEISLASPAQVERGIELHGPWNAWSPEAKTDSLFQRASPPRPPASARFISLPKDFKSLGSGQGIYYFATTLKLGKGLSAGEETYAMYIPSSLSALRLWVNGELVYEQGRVGLDQTSERPTRKYGIVSLPKAKDYRLVLAVSNFHHRNGGLRSPLHFGTTKAIRDQLHSSLGILGLIVGSLFIIGIYHIVQFIYQAGERANLFLGLGCLSIAIRSANSGNPRLILELFGSVDFLLSYRLEYLGLIINLACFAWFVASLFPNIASTWIIWTITGLCALYSLGVGLTDVAVFSLVLPYFQLLIIFSMLYAFYITAVALKQRRSGAAEFAVGMGAFIVCATLEILFLIQSISIPLSLLGGFLLVISQSFAVARHFSQQFQRLSFYEEQTRHAYTQIQKVFYPHQIEQMMAGSPLEQTMPSGEGQAVVISLHLYDHDLCNLPPIKRHEFIRAFLDRCQLAMDENYHQSPLQANAYRLKEHELGFQCAVGFPFANPGPYDDEDHAIRLCQQFFAILSDLNRAIGDSPTVHAVAGIAQSDIEGFYPETGMQLYEVRGESIIAAMACEDQQRQVVGSTDPQDIMIIEDHVYQRLNTNLAASFWEIDPDPTQIVPQPSVTTHPVYYYRFVSHELRDDWNVAS
jgi:hypothetical protein